MIILMMMIACYPRCSDHILLLLGLCHQTLELLVYPVEPVLKSFHFDHHFKEFKAAGKENNIWPNFYNKDVWVYTHRYTMSSDGVCLFVVRVALIVILKQRGLSEKSGRSLSDLYKDYSDA